MNQKDSEAGLVLLVMLSALCFLLLSSDPDARHLGMEGILNEGVAALNAAVAYLAGFAGDDIYAVFPSLSSGPGYAASVRYGPEGQFYSEILASRLSRWYLAVTFSACLARGIQELNFLGDDFDEFLYSAQCLFRQRIHAHASDHGGSGVEVAALAVNTGSGMCFAGLLVRIYLALCSLWLAGP